MLTIVLIAFPEAQAVLATHECVPQTPCVELDERHEDREVSLAVRLVRQIVVPLRQVEVLHSLASLASRPAHTLRATDLRYPDAVLVHPAQVPHRERTHLGVCRGLVVPSGLLPPHVLRFVWHAKAMIVVVTDLDKRVDVPLGG